MTENPRRPDEPGPGVPPEAAPDVAAGQQPGYPASDQAGYPASDQAGYPASDQAGYGALQQPPVVAGLQPHASGQPGAKYGTTAYDPGAVSRDVTEPKGWARLKTLTLVSFAVYVISGLLGFAGLNEDVMRESTVATLEAQGVAVTEEMIEQTLQIGMAVGMGLVIGSLVIGIILYLVVYLGLRNGKNWARILGTVLAVIGTAYTLFGLLEIGVLLDIAPTLGIITLILTIVFVAFNIWWLVTAYSKDVNAFLRARSGY